MLKDWHGAYNSGMKKHLQRFSGIERLYGKGSLQRLGQCHVAVIGIGAGVEPNLHDVFELEEDIEE